MIEPKIKFQTVKGQSLSEQELEKAKQFLDEKNPKPKQKTESVKVVEEVTHEESELKTTSVETPKKKTTKKKK